MKIRLTSLLLVFVLLLGVLPGAAVAEAAGTDAAVNSDLEAWLDGWYYTVDTMGEGLLLRERYAAAVHGLEIGDPVDRGPVTDFPVGQVLARQGELVVSVEDRLLALDPATGETTPLLTAPGPIDRFAWNGSQLYYLSGGQVYVHRAAGDRLLWEGVRAFWLEEDGALSCLTDRDSLIHTHNLTTGRESLRRNNASDLGDVPLKGSLTRSMHLGTLREKFPHGKYWNHMPTRGTGAACNNQDGWTEIPCIPHNGYCGTSLQTCNGFNPTNSYELSWQCMGYAEKCGYDVTGLNPREQWQTNYNVSALTKLKAGDIVRYRNGNHSIYVVAVDGDQVTYTDCNADGHCIIRWDQTISLSTLRASFSYVRSAPSEAPGSALALMQDLPGPSNWAYDAIVWAVENGIASGTSATTFSPDETCSREEVVTFLWRAAGSPAPKQEANPFWDVKASGFSYKAILWAAQTGITSGTSGGAFSPKEPCTRAQVVTFLWRFAGTPAPKSETCPFRDVEKKQFYTKAVLWALENKITAGTTADTFSPEEPCTRAQVVTFLYRLVG